MAEYQPARSSVGTHSQVASGIASVTILAANAKRKGLRFLIQMLMLCIFVLMVARSLQRQLMFH